MRALSVGLLLLGAIVALADDRSVVEGIEHDLASVDTRVRAQAREKLVTEQTIPDGERARVLRKVARSSERSERQWALEHLVATDLRSQPDAIGAAVDALEDPEPVIARLARERLVDLRSGEGRNVDVASIASRMLLLSAESDRFHFVQIIAAALDAGAVVSPGPLLRVGADAEHKMLVARSLQAARVAALVAPIVSEDLAALRKLLDRDGDARLDTIRVIGESMSAPAWRLLIELEGTSTSAKELEFVKNALDARRGEPDFEAILDDMIKTSPDAHIRDAARRRRQRR